MLNLMMTTLVWLLSMGLFQFSWVHHTFQQAFSSITPTLVESMITLSYQGDQWRVGFDTERVEILLFPYFEAHVHKITSSYSLTYLLTDDGLACTTYCSMMEIQLSYVNGGKQWNMSRRFVIDGIGY